MCFTALLATWPARLGGGTSYITTRGISMKPLLVTGDLAVVRTSNQYDVGEVVAYHSTDLRTVVLHRIVKIQGGHYTLKGDNNSFLDPDHPAKSQIVGKLAFRIPNGGAWFARLTSPAALAVLVFFLIAGGGIAVQTRRRRRRAVMSRHSYHSPRPHNHVFAMPRELRTTAAIIAGAAVLGLAIGALAFTASAERTITKSTPAPGQLTFSYSASVIRSAAYDGTTVHSPDPVYRKLAKSVDLHLAYVGDAGTLTVTAVLTTSGGWHSKVPLAAPVTFTGSRHTSTVPLNLHYYDRRAQAAAAATGVPAQSVTITVAAHIVTRAGIRFTPTMTLNLTPQQLTLGGDAKSLTAQNTTTVSHPVQIARQLNLIGHEITVSSARAWSAVLVLGALAVAALLGLLARATAPGSEGAGIRRQYAHMLAAVNPIATPTDLPVIEVSEFGSLATLAQRCGQLVLHWSRSGIDTFIVLDEGTTYRYRCSSDAARTDDPPAPVQPPNDRGRTDPTDPSASFTPVGPLATPHSGYAGADSATGAFSAARTPVADPGLFFLAAAEPEPVTAAREPSESQPERTTDVQRHAPESTTAARQPSESQPELATDVHQPDEQLAPDSAHPGHRRGLAIRLLVAGIRSVAASRASNDPTPPR